MATPEVPCESAAAQDGPLLEWAGAGGVLYHGTPEPFDTFRDPLGATDRGAGYDHQGPAIYLTNDPNGYARFFARESIPRLLLHAAVSGDKDREARLFDSDGFVLQVHLELARVLRIEHAPQPIRELFARSVGNFDAGLALRQAVLGEGFDALAFVEPNYPEGWEVRRNAMTVAVYAHDKARIIDAREAQSYKLPPGWSESPASRARPRG